VQAADVRVVRQTVRAQVTMLRCTVVEADGGGGLQLPEPMWRRHASMCGPRVELSCGL
jgi:hypothetical protein